MTDLRESAELSTGELLGDRYLLRERIGEGGMARVYRADDRHLQRTVAVKVFNGPAGSVGSVERALSETLLLASVSHHALVTVFDAQVSADEVSYLVMELVDGITLRELLARGPLDSVTAAAIGVDLAEGLHAAHEAGIVHRDIKPSNVLLGRSPLPGCEWRAKLADFGIAHLLDSTRLTTPGLLVGTAAYVAPEQARGAPPAPPADIYAFGIMLIEALTGHRPFADAEGIGTVMARLSESPEVPHTLPDVWQGLLRGMTAMRPEDRPSALEVAVTLARISAPDPAAGRSIVDEATAPLPAQIPPSADPTRTIAFSPRAAVTADVAVTKEQTGGAGHLPPARSTPHGPGLREEAARRRGLIIGAVVATLLLLAVLVGALWLSGLPGGGAEPTPSPSPSLVEEQPTPAPTEQAPPAQAPVVDDVTDGGGGNSGPGNGNGNGNGGPGNNGNGNGNGGNNGNGGGNGNGNGNG